MGLAEPNLSFHSFKTLSRPYPTFSAGVRQRKRSIDYRQTINGRRILTTSSWLSAAALNYPQICGVPWATWKRACIS